MEPLSYFSIHIMDNQASPFPFNLSKIYQNFKSIINLTEKKYWKLDHQLKLQFKTNHWSKISLEMRKFISTRGQINNIFIH
jgi:hypothetical protein